MRVVTASALVAFCILPVGSVVRAAETITYSYDALGRLVTVQHSGSVNSGIVATYTHDPADNRSNVTVTGASANGPAGRFVVVPLLHGTLIFTGN